MSITITLNHDIETLEALRDEWIDLQTRSSATRVELSWYWIYTFYKHKSSIGELWVMTAREEDNRLLGIAPFIRVDATDDDGDAWQQIEFIGVLNHDEHLDFIIETGYEKQVILLFIDKLYEHRSQWDVIRLSGLADTKTIDVLQQSKRDWIEWTDDNIVAPYMKLPDSVDNWMQSLSSKRRSSIRRDYRRLDKQFPDRWSIKTVSQPDELDETFNQLVLLHQEFWELRGEVGNFDNGELVDFYYELIHCLLKNGSLRMYRLDIDGKPCAIDFCCHYLNRAHGLITATKRDVTNVGLGVILKHHGIEQAIIEGCFEFALGEGEMPYKYSLGGVDRVHRTLILISNTRIFFEVKTEIFLRKLKSRIAIRSRIQGIKSFISSIVQTISMNKFDETEDN